MPEGDIVGVTAILLTCSYNDDQEFMRVGYYVKVEYDNQEMNDNPPAQTDISRLTRHILAEKPRVTKFQIDWDLNANAQTMNGENNNPNVGGAALEEGMMMKGT